MYKDDRHYLKRVRGYQKSSLEWNRWENWKSRYT